MSKVSLLYYRIFWMCLLPAKVTLIELLERICQEEDGDYNDMICDKDQHMRLAKHSKTESTFNMSLVSAACYD